MKKITILGDIMNEPVMLAEAKKADGSYDYYPAFAPLQKLMDEADYRIANLETPLAGEEAGWTANIFQFNTPDTIADALKKLGIDALSFANNHTFDRGQAGMLRTLKVLKEKGFAVTGAFEDPKKDRIAYFTLGDTKVAWVAYILCKSPHHRSPSVVINIWLCCVFYKIEDKRQYQCHYGKKLQ